MWKKRMITLFLIMLIVLSLSFMFDRPSIFDATYDDLCEIKGIGPVSAGEIVNALEWIDCIDDLEKISGIGKEKIKLVKRCYDD